MYHLDSIRIKAGTPQGTRCVFVECLLVVVECLLVVVECLLVVVECMLVGVGRGSAR